MAERNTADVLVERLVGWGVDRVFGYSGDGIDGVMGALRLLNGLYDAKLGSQPVVAIVGQQVSTVLGSAYQQEIDLVRLFGDVCAQFVQQAHTAEQVPMLIDRAFRTAIATRSPTCVVLPHDVQTAPAPDPEA